MSRAHSVLGVSVEATRDEVRSAFRKKARELHPDTNPNAGPDERRLFDEVVEAYRTLETRLSSPARQPEVKVEYPVTTVPVFVAATYRRYGETGVDVYA